ncbi:MAG TPA: hypothetical protein PL128_01200 [Ginsengibacter sp.]|nr:hypothetical protein [Ginsengibacter sp.]
MDYSRQKQLQKAIIKLEDTYPDDDLILSYSDFLKVRDYLPYYQFNPAVMYKLVQLTNNTWSSATRISRLSLLQKIKQYYYTTVPHTPMDRFVRGIIPDYPLPAETRLALFDLFRKTFEEKKYLTLKQIETAKRICNNLLINKGLNPEAEAWFCKNAFESDLILNRTLRYPLRSVAISRWARTYFLNDKLRIRRAELTGWILDENPDYEITQQVLIDDFEYLNKTDKEAIQFYDEEFAASKIIEKELSEFLPKSQSYRVFDDSFYDDGVEVSFPELKLNKRPYRVPEIDSIKHYPFTLPDYEKMKQNFYANLQAHQMITMVWSIGYSHLDHNKKLSLFKKYYSSESYFSLYKIAVRTKNTTLLRWLLEQQR